MLKAALMGIAGVLLLEVVALGLLVLVVRWALRRIKLPF